MSLRLRSFWILAALLCFPGCALRPPELVEQHRFRPVDSIRRVAVVPFYPHERLSNAVNATNAAGGSATSASDAASLVSRFMSEALAARGIDVIPETDVRLAFEGQGQVIPRQAPEVAAELAAAEFGADAILLGEVRRFRENEGSAYGSASPASVDFQVTLYSAPRATRLWTAEFDQTQSSITGNPLQSARYPSGGSRFLTVAELARFGAELIAKQFEQMVGKGTKHRSRGPGL